MNAPERLSRWRPRRNSLAERVLEWLPECPQQAATATDIAIHFGVSKPENVHGQLSSAVEAGAIERLRDMVPHLYRLSGAAAELPQRAPAAAAHRTDAVEQLGWVKCSSEMPDAGRKVLAYSKDRKLEPVTQALFFPATADGPAVWREVTFAELGGVTHWAPMPGGPKR